MKRYTTGLLTGLLLTVSAFMFMGANNQPSNENGRYQIIPYYNSYMKIMMLDTRDGSLYLSDGKAHKSTPEVVTWIKKTRPNPFPENK